MIKNVLPTVWRRSDSPVRRTDENAFLTLQREMNQMFDDFFHGFEVTPFGGERSFGSFSPSVDVRENETEISIRAELPGLTENDIEVTVADDALTLRGVKKEEKENKSNDYFHRETRYGSFSRIIPLPSGLNAEKVDARFKNGVLTVVLPRLPDAKAKGKKVAIKAEQ